jgi:Rod binding domain-containing protein
MDAPKLSPAAPEPAAPAQTGRGRLEAAARDFEALMLSELLRAARLNGSAAWLGEEDAAADSAFGLAEEHFARSLAGSLGLARLVTEGLDPMRSSSATPSRKPGQP